MPKRVSALRALELLTNTDDVDSNASGDCEYELNDDDDFDRDFTPDNDDNADDDFDDVNVDDDLVDDNVDDEDGVDSENDEDDIHSSLLTNENSDQQTQPKIDQILDKSSKAGVIWAKLNGGDETKIRKRINFNNEKSGPPRGLLE